MNVDDWDKIDHALTRAVERIMFARRALVRSLAPPPGRSPTWRQAFGLLTKTH